MPISLAFFATPYGQVFAAVQDARITHLAFGSNVEQAETFIRRDFPNTVITHEQTPLHDRLFAFLQAPQAQHDFPLTLCGTAFQQSVWEALQQIPAGSSTTYGDIAARIGKPQAHRAVGTAVGANRIAILIPCHRVVPAAGGLGNYHWGPDIKKRLLAHEDSRAV